MVQNETVKMEITVADVIKRYKEALRRINIEEDKFPSDDRIIEAIRVAINVDLNYGDLGSFVHQELIDEFGSELSLW